MDGRGPPRIPNAPDSRRFGAPDAYINSYGYLYKCSDHSLLPTAFIDYSRVSSAANMDVRTREATWILGEASV